jgi:hypothetical protein
MTLSLLTTKSTFLRTIGGQQFAVEDPAEWCITRTVQQYCATNVGTFEVAGGCNASLFNIIGSSKHKISVVAILVF